MNQKDLALANILHILVTLDTFHLLSGWLKDVPLNISAIERVRNGPSVGGSFAARWARMVLKMCSSERGEREKRFYGGGKGERRRTAL